MLTDSKQQKYEEATSKGNLAGVDKFSGLKPFLWIYCTY
jgi:hypothetical protein